ncbi:MAG: hypothetical protein KGQ59_00780 [Bdellovibrionales bacterium]|nr:hypothetical protein [Bdellovibrionales bacterium]
MATTSAEKLMDRYESRSQGFRTRAAQMGHEISERAKNIPASGFVAAAGLSAIASLVLATSTRQKSWANFVGLWAPSLLLLGIYNKLVKLEKKSRI